MTQINLVEISHVHALPDADRLTPDGEKLIKDLAWLLDDAKLVPQIIIRGNRDRYKQSTGILSSHFGVSAEEIWNPRWANTEKGIGDELNEQLRELAPNTPGGLVTVFFVHSQSAVQSSVRVICDGNNPVTSQILDDKVLPAHGTAVVIRGFDPHDHAALGTYVPEIIAPTR